MCHSVLSRSLRAIASLPRPHTHARTQAHHTTRGRARAQTHLHTHTQAYDALDDPETADLHRVTPNLIAFKGPLAPGSHYQVAAARSESTPIPTHTSRPPATAR